MSVTHRFLGAVERLGNRLPDPAMLFLGGMLIVWVISWLLSGHVFTVPSLEGERELAITNQLSGESLATFLATMVKTKRGSPISRICRHGTPPTEAFSRSSLVMDTQRNARSVSRGALTVLPGASGND